MFITFLLDFVFSEPNASSFLFKNDSGNLFVQFISIFFGILQSLLKFVLNEFALFGPLFEAFCDEVVGKLIEFLI